MMKHLLSVEKDSKAEEDICSPQTVPEQNQETWQDQLGQNNYQEVLYKSQKPSSQAAREKETLWNRR